MKKRIFIGIPISQIVKDFIKRWRESHPLKDVRWIDESDLHITLIPPWYEENTEDTINKIKTVKSPSFGIPLLNIRTAPNFREPRMIWLIGDAPWSLLNLKKDLEKALIVNSEEREYHPHVTILRFNLNKNPKGDQKNLVDEYVNLVYRANEFILYESHLNSVGAQYTILEKFNLKEKKSYQNQNLNFF